MIEYVDYIGLIKSRAGRWADKTEIDYETFFSEGNEVFVKEIKKIAAKKGYDKKKGAKFSTYLYQRLNGRFSHLAHMRALEFKRIHRATKDQLSFGWRMIDIDDFVILQESLADLPDDAKFIVRLIFDAPADFISMIQDETDKAQIFKKHITQYLRSKGWTFVRIWKHYKDIKGVLS